MRTRVALLQLLACCLLCGCVAFAQPVEVTGSVQVTHPAGHTSAHKRSSANVVVWLTSTSALETGVQPSPHTGHFRLVQKDKQFTPHLLVVPTGSSVEFPNEDPFFHNVFSLFNGQRFDLGLYEAGSKRSVHFDHEGVSYIFCNIHPEMSAVVIALSTPYFGISSADGAVTLHDVPVGSYEMRVWAESSDPKQRAALTRRVHIGPGESALGTIEVNEDSEASGHKNKFGEDYSPSEPPPY